MSAPNISVQKAQIIVDYGANDQINCRRITQDLQRATGRNRNIRMIVVCTSAIARNSAQAAAELTQGATMMSAGPRNHPGTVLLAQWYPERLNHVATDAVAKATCATCAVPRISLGSIQLGRGSPTALPKFHVLSVQL